MGEIPGAAPIVGAGWVVIAIGPSRSASYCCPEYGKQGGQHDPGQPPQLVRDSCIGIRRGWVDLDRNSSCLSGKGYQRSCRVCAGRGNYSTSFILLRNVS